MHTDLSGPAGTYGVSSSNAVKMRFDEVNEKGRHPRPQDQQPAQHPEKHPKNRAQPAKKRQGNPKRKQPRKQPRPTTKPQDHDPKAQKKSAGHSPPTPTNPPTSTNTKNRPTPAPQREKARGAPAREKKSLQKGGDPLQQDQDRGEGGGGTEAVKALNLPVCGKATYKRGATDFSSQVATLRGSGCDFVVLGAVLQETVGALAAEARKSGWDVPMLVQAAGYSAQVPALGGKVTGGVVRHAVTPHPYPDEANKKLMAWIASYKQKFSADPNAYTAIGYAQSGSS